ncbi:hypothetical protein SAMN06893096_103322 [Geodermatophilus pulveris]|uniref:Uncharacterized protein n=1 Tax=Geodermatophilus pulveris TaxID=1564159 RepID=A0A239DS33_9ACTN|nr:hypothetical protein [Geodermatophilus pulveris]SNS34738.1 hypothetical protein SAMN06893096_103322 [Geodermatophilus pulveris]
MTRTRTRRWRLAAAGLAIAATSFTAAACGSDTGGEEGGVEQEMEDEGDDEDD